MINEQTKQDLRHLYSELVHLRETSKDLTEIFRTVKKMEAIELLLEIKVNR